MNTRSRKPKFEAEKPSVKWHIMHENYHVIFAPEYREQVELWYNKVATGKQRDAFRRICKEIYLQDLDGNIPEYSADYTRQVALCEAKMMIKYYGDVFSDIGKKHAWLWILNSASAREKNSFSEIFTGARGLFVPKSVMKTDYIPPEKDVYDEIDRTNFICSVNLANEEILNKRRKLHTNNDGIRRLSLKESKERITKPKSQFDGVTPLRSLGFAGENEEEIMAALRKKLDAEAELNNYYTVDGCTVYIAGGAKKTGASNANNSNDIVMAKFYAD